MWRHVFRKGILSLGSVIIQHACCLLLYGSVTFILMGSKCGCPSSEGDIFSILRGHSSTSFCLKIYLHSHPVYHKDTFEKIVQNRKYCLTFKMYRIITHSREIVSQESMCVYLCILYLFNFIFMNLNYISEEQYVFWKTDRKYEFYHH